MQRSLEFDRINDMLAKMGIDDETLDQMDMDMANMLENGGLPDVPQEGAEDGGTDDSRAPAHRSTQAFWEHASQFTNKQSGGKERNC